MSTETEARTVSWYGALHNVDPNATVDEVLVETGLNYTVGKVANSYRNPVTGETVDAKGSHTVVRFDTGAQLANGSVGNVQTFCQNRDLLLFGRTVEQAGADSGVVLDQVGPLRKGATVLATFRLPAASFAPAGLASEQVDTFLVVKNPHDGSGCLTGDLRSVRLFCQNEAPTLKGSTFKVSHTGTLDERFAAARAVFDVAAAYAANYLATAERLLAVEVEREQVEQFVRDWVPLDPKRERGADKVLAEQDALLGNVLGSPTVPRELRSTAWGVLQGATEWAEHLREYRSNVRTPNREARFLRNQPGGAVDRFRNRALRDLTALLP